jgi:hypothetical protein
MAGEAHTYANLGGISWKSTLHPVPCKLGCSFCSTINDQAQTMVSKILNRGLTARLPSWLQVFSRRTSCQFKEEDKAVMFPKRKSVSLFEFTLTLTTTRERTGNRHTFGLLRACDTLQQISFHCGCCCCCCCRSCCRSIDTVSI